MKTERWVQEELKTAKQSFEFRLETLMIELGESIALLMKKHCLTRTELAHRLGVSKAYVTKILNGKPNLTLETLLRLSDALEGQLKLDIVPKVEAKTNTIPQQKPLVERTYEIIQPAVAGGANDFAIAA
jgi:transcriptional regulator with XRE-family HTH domain